MILFKEDWAKHPGSIVDWDTTNTTWVDIVAVYEEIGVENRYFPLALHNPSLKGIDPFDPDLEPEVMAQIAIECYENPWYFFREVLRLRNAGAAEAVKFRAHRGNIAMIWCYCNHVTSFSLWPRQNGKSAAAEGIDVWVGGIRNRNSTMHIYCKDDQLRRNIIAREKSMMDELPRYLDVRTKKDTNNTEEITWNVFGNKMYTSVAQSSIKAALNIGRGLPIVHERPEELAFCENNDKTLPQLLAAGSAARKSAEDHDGCYGTIITTTAGFLNSNAGAYAKKIYDDCLPWTELLYDTKDTEDLCNTIRKNNKIRIESSRDLNKRPPVQVLLEFNHRQLGQTDEELRRNIENALSEGENRDADFFNIWGHGNSESPISKQDLQRIMDSRYNNARETIDKNGYITRWYTESNPDDVLLNDYHIMSIDTSDAIGSDDIFKTILSVRTGDLIAAGRYNEVNTITLSNYFVDLLIKYPKLTLIIERKSSAMAMLDNMFNILVKNGIDPYRRIYNLVVDEYDTNNYYKEILTTKVQFRDINMFNRTRKFFGYVTAGSGKHARDKIYNDAFNMAIKNIAHLMKDPVIISQATMLIRKNGRIDHPLGEHDDGIFSWLLAYWFLMSAKNKYLYGIPEGIVLSSIIRDKSQVVDIEAEIIEKKNELIKLEMENIRMKIASATSEATKAQLTARYKKLADSIGYVEKEILNVDEIKRPQSDLNTINRVKAADRYIRTLSVGRR